MIVEIGNIIKSKLQAIHYVEKLAGVVKILTYQVLDKDNKPIIKKMPIACDVSFIDCLQGKYRDLVPDSKLKSIYYLEDITLRANGRRGMNNMWVASYRLVGWLNLERLGSTDCSITGRAIMHINKLLCNQQHTYNNGIYQNIQMVITGQEPKTGTSPFQKFSYDETVAQYLMYPFDYFSLLIDVKFETNPECLTDFNPGMPIACPQP